MRLGLIGFGSIATTLVGLLEPGECAAVTALARPETAAAARKRAADAARPATIVESVEALLAAKPDIVVECAGHDALGRLGPAVLAAGVDLIAASVGALADDELHAALDAAAAASGARLAPTAGAIGGLDLLRALAPAGDLQLRYDGVKPPAAWKGSAAEARLDLDALREKRCFFEGSAREAARAFPKNANVVAALALAGAGFEATRVMLWADPAARANAHAYEAVSPLGRMRVEIEGAPSANPRTSATTARSLLAELRQHASFRGAATPPLRHG